MQVTLEGSLSTAFISCVLFKYIMTYNPYVFQVMQQTGMSEAEVRATSAPASLTLSAALEHGFETIEEYEEAIREYVYG